MGDKREEFLEGVLEHMKAHFGSAARKFWVYDGEICPACKKRRIEIADYQGEKALSINGYMYRELGVLIAYMLCWDCVQTIMTEFDGGPTSLHPAIERNLSEAYLLYLNSMDA